MRNSIHSILRRLTAETGGAEIAEAAAVLPLMFMILLGIFWFGQAFSIYGAITRAAQEGARAGAAPYCTTCSSPNSLANSDSIDHIAVGVRVTAGEYSHHPDSSFRARPQADFELAQN
jgi:Flp pilus assembly protein TadG